MVFVFPFLVVSLFTCGSFPHFCKFSLCNLLILYYFFHLQINSWIVGSPLSDFDSFLGYVFRFLHVACLLSGILWAWLLIFQCALCCLIIYLTLYCLHFACFNLYSVLSSVLCFLWWLVALFFFCLAGHFFICDKRWSLDCLACGHFPVYCWNLYLEF